MTINQQPYQVFNRLAVDVCGKRFTSLSWFVGDEDPSELKCKHALKHCLADAVLLEGSHTRRLANTVFAKRYPEKPKPLLGNRRRLSSVQFVQTDVTGLKVKRCDGVLGSKRKSQILWSVDSLHRAWKLL